MLMIVLVLISLSGGPKVAPSTATGCSFVTPVSVDERPILMAGSAAKPRMSRRCRGIRAVQLWMAARRPSSGLAP
jgi:hypothetical protein